jgi:endonuclease/exonuclease/phosphatase family metal-dependent hydrolase
MLVAQIDLGRGQGLRVVVAHPVPPSFEGGILGIGFTGFDPQVRDTQLDAIRAALDEPLASEGTTLLLGDFNVTDRELGYADLARGLTDAHRAVGLGPGSTWRPPGAEWLPFGLLRIDMVFTRGDAHPLSISPDCTPRGSDHCILSAKVQVRR